MDSIAFEHSRFQFLAGESGSIVDSWQKGHSVISKKNDLLHRVWCWSCSSIWLKMSKNHCCSVVEKYKHGDDWGSMRTACVQLATVNAHLHTCTHTRLMLVLRLACSSIIWLKIMSKSYSVVVEKWVTMSHWCHNERLAYRGVSGSWNHCHHYHRNKNYDGYRR